jgi:hypothetical protein
MHPITAMKKVVECCSETLYILDSNLRIHVRKNFKSQTNYKNLFIRRNCIYIFVGGERSIPYVGISENRVDKEDPNKFEGCLKRDLFYIETIKVFFIMNVRLMAKIWNFN